MNKPNWEEQLGKMFNNWKLHNKEVGCFHDSLAQNSIKSFIHQLLIKEREEIVKKLEGMKKEKLPVGLGHTLYGYNQALTEAIKIIKERK